MAKVIRKAKRRIVPTKAKSAIERSERLTSSASATVAIGGRGEHRGPTRGVNLKLPGDSLGVNYRSPMEAGQLVLDGLPFASLQRLQQTSGITTDRLAEVARLSKGSLTRRRRSGRFSVDESERVLRVGRVFELAMGLFEGDIPAATEWLESPIASLANQCPLDLARTEPGARQVEDLITRLEHGVVA